MLASWALLAARTLGADGYGLFAGLGGLASAAAGFVGLGTGLLMYQRVANHPALFSSYWVQAKVLSIASSAILASLFLAAAAHNSATSMAIIALLAVSEIILFPHTTLAAFAFSAHGRMGWSAALPAINACARLIAMLIVAENPTKNPLGHYLWMHLGASLTGACISWLAVRQILSPQKSTFCYPKTDAIEGISFAAGWFTATSMTTLDKSIVLRNAGENIAGIYASSYRIASIFTMPIDAMIMSAMPRLFRSGPGQPSQKLLITAMCAAITAYSTTIAFILWFLSDWLAALLGPQYAMAGAALRWMTAWPLLYGLRQIACSALVGRGQKVTRAVIEGLALLLMLFLAYLLLPQYDIRGAVVMLLASESFILLASWTALLLHTNSSDKINHI